MSAWRSEIYSLRAALAASEREAADLKQRLSIHDDGMAEARAEVERCRDLIVAMVANACEVSEDCREYMDPPAPLDSCGMSTNSDALRYLAEIGRVEIISEAGRRVVARWKP